MNKPLQMIEKSQGKQKIPKIDVNIYLLIVSIRNFK
jgi:hypothetical protein